MLSRFLLAIRIAVGAIIGAILGVVLVLSAAVAIEAAIGGSGGWAAAFALFMWGGLVGALGGALFGGWIAWRATPKKLFGALAPTALVLVVGALVAATWYADSKIPPPVPDALGCVNEPQFLSFSPAGSVQVFDRYCPTAPRHTLNVSLDAGLETRDAGNVFVIDADRPNAKRNGVDADGRDSTHVVINYDTTARVFLQRHSWGRVAIAYENLRELGLPRQANQPPESVTRTPPIEAPKPARPVRDSVVPYRPSAPGPLDRTDGDGCTIHPRVTLDRYERHIAVYDRDCAMMPHRTMNVALLAPGAVLGGLGNIMVLSIDGAPGAVLTGAEIPVTVTLPDARHMEILYDRRFNVIGHGFPGDSLQITFGPRPQGAP